GGDTDVESAAGGGRAGQGAVAGERQPGGQGAPGDRERVGGGPAAGRQACVECGTDLGDGQGTGRQADDRGSNQQRVTARGLVRSAARAAVGGGDIEGEVAGGGRHARQGAVAGERESRRQGTGADRVRVRRGAAAGDDRLAVGVAR